MLDTQRDHSWSCLGSRLCVWGGSMGGCALTPSRCASPPCTPGQNCWILVCLNSISKLWGINYKYHGMNRWPQTGQFVFEISERQLWLVSDFGKQRPQLLQCSYFSLPPTLVNIKMRLIHWLYTYYILYMKKQISFTSPPASLSVLCFGSTGWFSKSADFLAWSHTANVTLSGQRGRNEHVSPNDNNFLSSPPWP